MNHAAWDPVRLALDRAGCRVAFWLRDDDAVEVTPALDRLSAVAGSAGAPILLAVIPAGADASTPGWLDGRPGVTPCQHGYSHANHAGPGARACELGGTRPLASVLDDLRRGDARMRELFGARVAPVLVPPWNRIDATLLPHLGSLGFEALSGFGAPPATAPLPHLNCDLDIMDWRNGRVGRAPAEVAAKLAALIEDRSRAGRPIGLLAHHLAHDGTAWAVLEAMLNLLRDHPAAHFVAVSDLLAERGAVRDDPGFSAPASA